LKKQLSIEKLLSKICKVKTKHTCAKLEKQKSKMLAS